MEDTPAVIWTIGHSTRPIEEFIAMLTAHRVQKLVDVRTVPRSRHVPQFNKDALPQPLRAAGIHYLHMPSLGGLRRPRPDSPNTGWRNAGFRGYADYMQTPEFEAALEELIRQARQQRIAIMCAEAAPWRCHRSLIADALSMRGIPVEHIMNTASARAHALKVDGFKITYPP
jgi:uncharacterized protein (DUF488 family)